MKIDKLALVLGLFLFVLQSMAASKWTDGAIEIDSTISMDTIKHELSNTGKGLKEVIALVANIDTSKVDNFIAVGFTQDDLKGKRPEAIEKAVDELVRGYNSISAVAGGIQVGSGYGLSANPWSASNFRSWADRIGSWVQLLGIATAGFAIQSGGSNSAETAGIALIVTSGGSLIATLLGKQSGEKFTEAATVVEFTRRAYDGLIYIHRQSEAIVKGNKNKITRLEGIRQQISDDVSDVTLTRLSNEIVLEIRELDRSLNSVLELYDTAESQVRQWLKNPNSNSTELEDAYKDLPEDLHLEISKLASAIPEARENYRSSIFELFKRSDQLQSVLSVLGP